jgi:hypothetical protein
MEDITPEIIDLRGLEAPEPMEIILYAYAKLGPVNNHTTLHSSENFS